jgi:hypothetical protein
LKKYTIEPTKGVGPFLFGMSKPELKFALLKEKILCDEVSERIWYCCDNALSFEFDDKGILIYIGVSHSISGDFEIDIFGVNPFLVSSHRLFKIISNHDRGVHIYDGIEYLFRNLIVAVYDASEQYNYYGLKADNVIFGVIGVGSSEYLEIISGLNP